MAAGAERKAGKDSVFAYPSLKSGGRRAEGKRRTYEYGLASSSEGSMDPLKEGVAFSVRGSRAPVRCLGLPSSMFGVELEEIERHAQVARSLL
jgi:hypothetical protein